MVRLGLRGTAYHTVGIFAVAKFREIAVFALEQTFTVYIFVFTGQGN